MSKKIEKEMREETLARHKEEQTNRLKDYCDNHTKGPVSRRDFLNAGLISFSASLTLPTVAGLIMPSRAMAQMAGCPSADAGSGLAPFVTLNLSGGAMLAANYVPMDAGGQTIASYDKMGMGNSSVPIEREFGNVPFAGNGISKLLTEMRSTASATTLANTAFVAIPCRSRDDSSDNMLDASGMVAAAGRVGQELPNLGSRDSDTGNKNRFSKVKPPNPLRVRAIDDINGALTVGGAGALSALGDDQKLRLLRLIQNLSSNQARALANNSGGQTLGHLVKCATGKNLDVAQKPQPALDIRDDATVAGIWGVNNNTNQRDRQVVFGSMVNACLTGSAGTVSLEMGGYDYHNQTRTTGDTRDGEAGQVIGRILETAAQQGQKVFIHVTSDGACVSPISDDRAAPWRSDRGSAGISYMLAYDPAGRPQTSGFQVGHFTDAQAADDSFITGNSPELASAAVFANYLKWNNRMDLLNQVISGTFSNDDLDLILKFS